MRFIIVILFSLTMLLSQDISEKMIISGDQNSTMTQMHLLKLRTYFVENAQIRTLQEKYNLNLGIETLGDYTIVVIKPIESLAVKNELLQFLSPLFPNIISIKDNKNEVKIPNRIKARKTIKIYTASPDTNIMRQASVLVEKIGLQWVSLLFLSILGLTLSLSSRRKMANLENIQKDLNRKQEQIENEINNLGAPHV